MESWFGKGGHRTDQAFVFFSSLLSPGRKYFIPTFCFFFLGRGREGLDLVVFLLGEVLKLYISKSRQNSAGRKE